MTTRLKQCVEKLSFGLNSDGNDWPCANGMGTLKVDHILRQRLGPMIRDLDFGADMDTRIIGEPTCRHTRLSSLDLVLSGANQGNLPDLCV